MSKSGSYRLTHMMGYWVPNWKWLRTVRHSLGGGVSLGKDFEVSKDELSCLCSAFMDSNTETASPIEPFLLYVFFALLLCHSNRKETKTNKKMSVISFSNRDAGKDSQKAHDMIGSVCCIWIIFPRVPCIKFLAFIEVLLEGDGTSIIWGLVEVVGVLWVYS